MSTHVPGFQHFPRFLHYFMLTQSATSSIKVNESWSGLRKTGNTGEVGHQEIEKEEEEETTSTCVLSRFVQVCLPT